MLQPILQQDFGDCCSLVKDTLSLQHHVSHLWDEDDKIDFINRLKNNVVAELNLSENPVNELVDLLHVNFCETLTDDNTRIMRNILAVKYFLVALSLNIEEINNAGDEQGKEDLMEFLKLKPFSWILLLLLHRSEAARFLLTAACSYFEDRTSRIIFDAISRMSKMQTVRIPERVKETLISSYCKFLEVPATLQWFKVLDNGEDGDAIVSEKEREIERNSTSKLHEGLKTEENTLIREEEEKKETVWDKGEQKENSELRAETSRTTKFQEELKTEKNKDEVEECNVGHEVEFESECTKEIQSLTKLIPDEIFLFPNEVRLRGKTLLGGLISIKSGLFRFTTVVDCARLIVVLRHELSHKKWLLQGSGNVFTKKTPERKFSKNRLLREAGTSTDILLYGESVFGKYPAIEQITEPIAIKILNGERLTNQERFLLFFNDFPSSCTSN